MRNLFYQKRYQALLTPEIVALLGQLHERKAEQNLFVAARADTLVHLVEIAKIQSTEASNRIEGIYTSDERLKKLVLDKTRPATRGEQEIAGYRDVLNTIHTNYEYIPPKPSYILQLHRDLYKFNGLVALIKMWIMSLRRQTPRGPAGSDSNRYWPGRPRRPWSGFAPPLTKP